MSDLTQKNSLSTKNDCLSQALNLSIARITVLVAAVCAVACSQAELIGQDRFKDFSATNVFREVNGNPNGTPDTMMVDAWWNKHVQDSMREVQPLPADLHTVLYLAIHHSNQIKIAKMDPLIRETAIQEADSAFDWIRYLNTAWNDTSEPVSNALTVGGNETRFNDQTFQGSAGVRRVTRSGGQLDISQRFGWQDNNSQFFTPNDQATGRLTLSYTHPLLRGRGSAYNNAIVFLAQIDSTVAQDEFLGVLQDELLEITRAYWNLHLERAVLAHQLRLYLKTKEIYKTLTARQAIDAQGTQAVLAASALESRRADLIRAQTAVTNSETRLRGMINAAELGNSDELELIPSEPLPDFQYHTDLQSEIEIALKNRPEVRAAVQQVKAGSLRLGVAKHELLPALNLVTQGYLAGLRGDNDFSGALEDQFTTGRPSYSVGLQYELPVGNRLAKARVCRRQHELTRLQSEYARALQAVQTEVDIAVRELQTSHREINAKRRALAAAEAEVNTIEQRWKLLIDGSGTSSLNLESLLRAQERVTAAEREYVTSQLTYSLAMVNLKRANGTLLQGESISVTPTCDPTGCRNLVLEKYTPGMADGIQVDSSCGPNCGCQSCADSGLKNPTENTREQLYEVEEDPSAVAETSPNQWESTIVQGNPQPRPVAQLSQPNFAPREAQSVIVERDSDSLPLLDAPQHRMSQLPTAPSSQPQTVEASGTPWGSFDFEKNDAALRSTPLKTSSNNATSATLPLLGNEEPKNRVRSLMAGQPGHQSAYPSPYPTPSSSILPNAGMRAGQASQQSAYPSPYPSAKPEVPRQAEAAIFTRLPKF